MEGKDDAIKKEVNKDLKNLDMLCFDLTVEILTRMPSKSVMKFQCVSKVWASIIQSQVFANHFMVVSTEPSRFMITIPVRDSNEFFIFSSTHKRKESSSSVANLDLTFSRPMDLQCFVKCTFVRGFICFEFADGFLICNPSTRQIIDLPECKAKKNSFTFFGYDPVKCKYKVLYVTNVLENGIVEYKVSTIRRPNKEPSWKHLETTLHYKPVSKGLYMEGFVYYVARSQKPSSRLVIICFDVSSETLSWIKFPPSSKSYDRWGGYLRSVLINLKGKLTIIQNSNNLRGLDLWILLDDEWLTQRFEFPTSIVNIVIEHICSISGINSAGEIILCPQLLIPDEPFYIFYVNIGSNKVRRVNIQGFVNNEEFRRCVHGNFVYGPIFVSPEQVENITIL